MSLTPFTRAVLLTCTAMAVAVTGCNSDQSQGAEGIGSVDMTVTLAQPPSGPNEQIDTVDVSLYCDGVDPVLGVPRPPQSSPETFSINVATSQGPEPYNTIGLLEKQGLPAGNCFFSFTAVSNTGNTECTGELTVAIATNQTTQSEVVLACIHTPRYGGVRTDGTFNQCAEYRQILVTPTTQAIGNLVDVRTEVYDPDGDDVTVGVQAVGACSNVEFSNGDTAASCETVSGCEAVVNTVECTDVGLCQIIVAVSDDGFDSCTGLLPDGSNNNGARSTIDVDCTVAAGCGNGQVEPGEDCDPPDGIFCDDNCQAIDNCSPDPCNQDNACSPEVCSADPVDNSAICTPDPGSAAGNACAPPSGGTCDGQGNCVACTQDSDCEDNNACTDNACVAGACEFTNNDNNQCTTGGFPGTCSAGECVGLCAPDTCADNGIECQTDLCDPADGSCNAQNDGINTGCDLGGSPGVCDGAGACVECNSDGQCGSGESCVNNVCEATGVACDYDEDFEALVQADTAALGNAGFLVFGTEFNADGSVANAYGPFPAPNNPAAAAFSLIAAGEGGAEQGAQQIVIITDYQNRAAMTAGRVVEALTFQERTIGAGDVGKTLVFSFDAKRGDIGGASTAFAFIKTIDPANNFAQTNFVPVDTTSLPTTWGRLEVSLDIIPELQGQLIQFGFGARGTNDEPTGVFYDNLTFGTPGCGGGGGPECVVDADCPATGNDCTAAVCTAGSCGTSNVADGTACDNDTGTCSAGVCQPAVAACDYDEDFEALVQADTAALGNAGFLVFGTEFNADGSVANAYGPFPAPNNPAAAAFSLIAAGEGGAEQGAQQVVIITDYQNRAAMTAGRVVEALTFQERTIGAGDVGTTLVFSFDAKRGDIGGASTAFAFIKTIDPANNFAQTNFVPVDTTNLPTSWGRLEVSLDIIPELQGQLIQFGFAARGTNDEPTGVFYDNLTFGTPGCSVDNGGGGPTGELTVNGDFETGTLDGWTLFCDGPNAGSCSATSAQANGGIYSGNLVASVPAGGGPPSFPLMKQANIGIGTVAPNSPVTIRFDLFGSLAGPGGVVFAEFFSELSGGGTSKSEILSGAPLFPNAPNDWTAGWVSYTFNTTTGPDVSGGVTLQLKTDCGANAGCTVDTYWDNVSITSP